MPSGAWAVLISATDSGGYVERFRIVQKRRETGCAALRDPYSLGGAVRAVYLGRRRFAFRCGPFVLSGTVPHGPGVVIRTRSV